MANDNQQPEDLMKHFTDAVKTIVSVPKSTIDTPAHQEYHQHPHGDLTCPTCGMRIVRPDTRPRKDNE